METIICQHCKYPNTHFESIEIFDREHDAEKGIHVLVQNYKVKIDDDLSSNPSLRRDGIIIRLRCEICPKITEIALIQHKGFTLISELEREN